MKGISGHVVDGPVLPLLIRALLLVIGTVVVSGLLGAEDAIGPALALIVVIALGALPLPGTTARTIQAFGEVTVLALIIGSTPELGVVFVPLLLLAVFSTGQRAGLALGVIGGLTGVLSWCLAILSSTPGSQVADRINTPLVWMIMLIATGVIGGWIRRLTLENETHNDVAYENAFRLLTELQDVVRNLSLGLDPRTLAATLLDHVASMAPDSERVVSVRGSDRRLAPLVGSIHQSATSDRAAESASKTARPVSDVDPGGQENHAFPIRMGEQVVAVLSIRTPHLTAARGDAIQEAVDEVGTKLAAALVFEEVRQLATVDERLRLAREIHDGVAQEFASVAYMLDDLASRVPPDAAAELSDLRTHVRRVVTELRLSIFDLRVGVDDSIGLGTALSEHVQRVGQQSGLVVHTVLDEQGDRLTTATEIELLRIAQEAVTNVRKHAQASNLWVECTVEAPRAWVRVADDGVGLQPPRPQSMGLRGMRERAGRIGGDLTVGPRPGGGTVVEISVGNWDEEERS